jgi:hypothetical protein
MLNAALSMLSNMSQNGEKIEILEKKLLNKKDRDSV